MRIAISLLSFRPGEIGGAETYVRKLVANLVKVAPEDEIALVAFRDNADAITTPGARTAVVHRNDRQMVASRIGEAFTPYRDRLAEQTLAQLAPDVVLFPQQTIFPKHLSVPAVLTVHDIQHLLFPRNFGWFDRAFRSAVYPRSLRRADRIISISEFTRRALLERYELPPDRVRCVHSGFDPRPPSCVTTPEIPRPYVYFPAATFPHKNHRQLFDTIAALRRQGQFNYRLVLSGMQTSYWPKLHRHAEGLGLSDVITHVGFVPYDTVCGLYYGAEAVVFPTRFEGFGLPVLEAVSFDKKVIVSRLEVFDELGVPAEFCIDFAVPEQLRQALARPGPTVLTKTPSTWDDCARETLRVLREVAQ